MGSSWSVRCGSGAAAPARASRAPKPREREQRLDPEQSARARGRHVRPFGREPALVVDERYRAVAVEVGLVEEARRAARLAHRAEEGLLVARVDVAIEVEVAAHFGARAQE